MSSTISTLVEAVNHYAYDDAMPSAPRPTSVEAYAVARRLHEASEDSRQSFAAIASGQGLTAPQARFILRLHEATPMRDLAAHLACDKSNVTGIAARLTERGLVTTTRGSDRRVKLLALTAPGRKVRADLQQHVADASPAMTRLTQTERQTLVLLLDKLHDRSEPETMNPTG
jgi:DNA-binding MarR family transcriptional regulator